ncbi:T9SS type A sorting domain-containing protein [Hymenobacter sp. CRA2]|uniref:T9SS type A sorting domain-containing protein n=1 Tax=Hymenobacter sp. CRA2 TaxID=1955620 RepID=UPI00098F0F77|nr:T9SS type A sorting domain-containing protein [Hymenobacter sp. CRA2]OON66748.1 hypothetical protein B0919_21465 [Hymenobacter sp. CRA2]
MKKLLLPALLAFASLATLPLSTAQAQTCGTPTQVVTGTITANTRWTADKIYVLAGFVYVDNNAQLTIDPGTIIRGDKLSKGTLIIKQGARIIADGTAARPIVFTSNQAPGARGRGDWGGLIICGRAPVNLAGTPTVEGGVGAQYGGTDANDNSGTLRYVRIEYPGIAFGQDNEINGLTLAGVGAGTTIDYVQVSNSGDDSFEWFGGTVNAKHLVAIGATDDDFDTDNGYSGKVQYAVTLRNPAEGDISGSTAFESDNDAGGTSNNPRTSPVFSNVSAFLQGPGTGNFTRAMHLRRNTQISIFNSVLTGWPTGLTLDGAGAQANATSGALTLKNNVMADMGNNFQAAGTGTTTYDVAGFWNTAGNANTISTLTALALDANNFTLTSPSFLPQSTSPLLSGAAFADAKLAGGFFDNVAYRGAFGATNWLSGWTNFNPQTTDYCAVATSSKKASDQVQGLGVYPNPTAGASAVAFELRRAGAVTVRVLDVTGREVAVVTENQKLAAGKQEVKLPATLTNGVYTATVQTEETSAAVRFVVTK